MSYYQVDYHCTNCGTHSIKSFVYGMSAPLTAICPRCGCAAAHKSLAPEGRMAWESRKELL